MASLRLKKIKGRSYYYLDKTIQLPDGKRKRLSKYIGAKKPAGAELKKRVLQAEGYFFERESLANIEYALRAYEETFPVSKVETAKIERMRVGFANLSRELDPLTNDDMLNRFIVNFTYESNAIEGSSMTLKDVDVAINEGAVLEGKSLRDVYEARNSKRVFVYILKNKFKCTHAYAKRIHKIMMRDIDTRLGYKKKPNYLIGRRVKTSPPENVETDMDALFGWYAENRGTLHPLVLATLFHGKLVRIHPFADGNGRTGRFLLNAILMKEGYPPLVIRKITRARYIKYLDAYDAGQDIPLLRFMLENFKKTYRKFFEVYAEYHPA